MSSFQWEGILPGILLTCASVCLSSLEIEIEGEKGWAKGLPTWRRRNPLGGVPITGYHVSLSLFLIFLFLLGSGAQDWKKVVRSFSYLLFLVGSEDAYWYSLNYVFKEGVKRGTTRDHFQSVWTRLSMYAFLFSLGSFFWIASDVPSPWEDFPSKWNPFPFVTFLSTLFILFLLINRDVSPLYEKTRRLLSTPSVPFLSILLGTLKDPLLFSLIRSVSALASVCFLAVIGSSSMQIASSLELK